MSYLVLVMATQVVPEREKRKDALVSLHERAMQQFQSARIAAANKLLPFQIACPKDMNPSGLLSADKSGIATICQG